MKLELQVALLGIALILSSPNTGLAGGTVTTCDEASLRAALAGGGTVTFAVSGTIPLAGTLVITNSTTIDASGQAVAISGNGAVRVFRVNPGVSLTLCNLTVTNGFADAGGALYNAGGNVVVTHCTFSGNNTSGNAEANGGGIFQSGGTLMLLNSLFSANRAYFTNEHLNGQGCGGAIWFTGSIGMTNCVFENNSAGGWQGYHSGCGGGIYTTNGLLNASNCRFAGNGSWGGFTYGPRVMAHRGGGIGGAIFCGSGTVTVLESAIVGGYAEGAPAAGGGIFHTNGTLLLSNVVVVGNRAWSDTPSISYPCDGGAGDGGGIYSAAAATLVNCLVASNSAWGGRGVQVMAQDGNGGPARGGGVFNRGSLELIRCTVAGNNLVGGWRDFHAVGGGAYGAGVFCQGVHASAVNCTITANFAQCAVSPSMEPGGGGSACGGGFYSSAALTALTNCTITANWAISGITEFDYITNREPSYGGNLYAGATLQLVNVILSAGLSNNAYGPLVDLGHNLSSDASCAFTNVSSMNNTDPMLAPLSDNGGLTPTLALLPGSPAIDAGNPAAAPPTDQRGVARPIGSRPDIGAFEYGGALPPCSYSVVPTVINCSAALTNRTITVSANYYCDWTAASTVDWLTLSPTNGSGATNLICSIASNTNILPRQGTLVIAGQVVTVNQAGIPCSYALSPTYATFPISGGAGSANVTAPAGCPWTASSDASWLTITAGDSGAGNGTVSYLVATNDGFTTRFGRITVGGAVLTILQESLSGSCVDLRAGLISWWRAEASGLDSAGANHGVLLNGAGFDPGEVGTAFRFDGTSQCVQIAHAPSLIASNFSVEAWINPASQISAAVGQTLIFGQGYGLVQLVVRRGTTGVQVAWQFGANRSTFYDVASTNEIPLGQFSHVAGTWDGTALRLYVNGVMNAQSTPGAAPVDSGCPFFIGGFYSPSAGSCQTVSQFFHGAIDELGYYHRALSAVEILAIHAAGTAGKCSSYPSFVLASPVPANGHWGVPAVGPAGVAARFQRSADLVNWVDVSTNWSDGSGFLFLEDSNPFAPAGFYRIVSP